MSLDATLEPVVRPGAASDVRPRSGSRIAAYVELTKPRIGVMVLLTTAAGYALGSEAGVALVPMLHALVGTALIAGGANALNQLLERDTDAKMRRTEGRPLPTERLVPAEALAFGGVLCLLGTLYLTWAVNPLTGALGAATLLGYVFVYTPIKRLTPLSTLVGALPGAMPPLIGWAAARGELGPAAWAPFALLGVWQLPHFFAIAWIYREDYARAGIPVITVGDPEGRATGRQALRGALVLLPVSLLPTAMGLAGPVYFAGALILGIGFLLTVLTMAQTVTWARARAVFVGSLVYLPLVFSLMVLDKL